MLLVAATGREEGYRLSKLLTMREPENRDPILEGSGMGLDQCLTSLSPTPNLDSFFSTCGL